MNNRLGIQDETGFEAFYNFTLSAWMHVTAAVQYIDSALTGANLFGEGLASRKPAWAEGGLGCRCENESEFLT